MTPIGLVPNDLLIWISIASSLIALATTIYQGVTSGAKANAVMMADQAKRIEKLELALAGVPARDDLHNLHIALADMRGDLKAMGATMKGNAQVMERLELIVSRHEQHLLDEGKR